MKFATRRDRLRRLIRQAGLEALLVSSRTNVSYLTGFTGEASCLLLGLNGELFLSDARFTEQIAEECPGLAVLIRRPPTLMHALIDKGLRRLSIGSVGFESIHMTVGEWKQLAETNARISWVPTQGLVEQLRMIKDRQEVAAIRRAIDLAERGLAGVLQRWSDPFTETDVVRELEYEIRKCGGDGCSFAPIVAAGERSALPHAPPTARRISRDRFVLFDWGARQGGYVSDLTRVYHIGKISPKFERIYRIVLTAQQRAINAIRPGVAADAVDAAARRVIEAAGYGKQFGHGLGHGIGLDVHESPRLAARQSTKLRAGMVVTVEPGIYLPGWGGVRIEDDVLVTRDGCEVLSRVTKDLCDCILPGDA